MRTNCITAHERIDSARASLFGKRRELCQNDVEHSRPYTALSCKPRLSGHSAYINPSTDSDHEPQRANSARSCPLPFPSPSATLLTAVRPLRGSTFPFIDARPVPTPPARPEHPHPPPPTHHHPHTSHVRIHLTHPTQRNADVTTAVNLHTPTSASIPGVYTPAELLLLSTSPLAKLSVDDVDALRTLAPEVVRTRKQLKTLVWHARHPHHPTDLDLPRSHGRTSSHGSHASESEEDRATSWRRI